MQEFKNIRELFEHCKGPAQMAADMGKHQWTIERWTKTGIPLKEDVIAYFRKKGVSILTLDQINHKIRSK